MNSLPNSDSINSPQPSISPETLEKLKNKGIESIKTAVGEGGDVGKIIVKTKDGERIFNVKPLNADGSLNATQLQNAANHIVTMLLNLNVFDKFKEFQSATFRQNEAEIKTKGADEKEIKTTVKSDDYKADFKKLEEVIKNTTAVGQKAIDSATINNQGEKPVPTTPPPPGRSPPPRPDGGLSITEDTTRPPPLRHSLVKAPNETTAPPGKSMGGRVKDAFSNLGTSISRKFSDWTSGIRQTLSQIGKKTEKNITIEEGQRLLHGFEERSDNDDMNLSQGEKADENNGKITKESLQGLTDEQLHNLSESHPDDISDRLLILEELHARQSKQPHDTTTPSQTNNAGKTTPQAPDTLPPPVGMMISDTGKIRQIQYVDIANWAHKGSLPPGIELTNQQRKTYEFLREASNASEDLRNDEKKPLLDDSFERSDDTVSVNSEIKPNETTTPPQEKIPIGMKKNNFSEEIRQISFADIAEWAQEGHIPPEITLTNEQKELYEAYREEGLRLNAARTETPSTKSEDTTLSDNTVQNEASNEDSEDAQTPSPPQTAPKTTTPLGQDHLAAIQQGIKLRKVTARSAANEPPINAKNELIEKVKKMTRKDDLQKLLDETTNKDDIAIIVSRLAELRRSAVNNEEDDDVQRQGENWDEL